MVWGQRGVREDIWRGSAEAFRKCSLTQHCFSINSLCFMANFSLRGYSISGTLYFMTPTSANLICHLIHHDAGTRQGLSHK